MAKYKTIEEASKAAILLGLRSIAEYKATYKQDPRLPACPETVYRNDWAGFGMWSAFLGYDIKNIYSTIQEASETAIALGFTSVKEGYKQDTRLPTSPSNRYSDDWADLGGWSQFLK